MLCLSTAGGGATRPTRFSSRAARVALDLRDTTQAQALSSLAERTEVVGDAGADFPHDLVRLFHWR
ncbi:protein of unknown function [Candidatus Filomicrobium marinum]|uniref:Uncharacterized protein n=1 Tax=Candidatus Filomicrobium marinum TaxID=1608628 RepID=A0A0D6JCT7_9HYPH|nr:protein of unknown function [Candidatus Filomicrobium marinum]CPR17417.1 protein of unknown function [Candidatus Filomicrobium marinum]